MKVRQIIDLIEKGEYAQFKDSDTIDSDSGFSVLAKNRVRASEVCELVKVVFSAESGLVKNVLMRRMRDPKFVKNPKLTTQQVLELMPFFLRSDSVDQIQTHQILLFLLREAGIVGQDRVQKFQDEFAQVAKENILDSQHNKTLAQNLQVACGIFGPEILAKILLESSREDDSVDRSSPTLDSVGETRSSYKLDQESYIRILRLMDQIDREDILLHMVLCQIYALDDFTVDQARQIFSTERFRKLFSSFDLSDVLALPLDRFVVVEPSLKEFVLRNIFTAVSNITFDHDYDVHKRNFIKIVKASPLFVEDNLLAIYNLSKSPSSKLYRDFVSHFLLESDVLQSSQNCREVISHIFSSALETKYLLIEMTRADEHSFKNYHFLLSELLKIPQRRPDVYQFLKEFLRKSPEQFTKIFQEILSPDLQKDFFDSFTKEDVASVIKKNPAHYKLLLDELIKIPEKREYVYEFLRECPENFSVIFREFLSQDQQEEFFARVEAPELFVMIAKNLFNDDEIERFLPQAKAKVGEYCSRDHGGLLLWNVVGKGASFHGIDKVLRIFEDDFKISLDDYYLSEFLQFQRTQQIEYVLKKNIIRALLGANSQNSAEAEIRLDPQVSIRIPDNIAIAGSGEELKLARVKDLNFILKFFPQFLSDESLRQVAQNSVLIASINNTLTFYNSKFFSKHSRELFAKINLFVPDGSPKINLEVLNSFQDLVARKMRFPVRIALATHEVKESGVHKSLRAKKKFKEFCAAVSEQEKKALGIFSVDEVDFDETAKFLKTRLEDLQQRLRALEEEIAKSTKTDLSLIKQKQGLKTVIFEITEFDVEGLDKVKVAEALQRLIMLDGDKVDKKWHEVNHQMALISEMSAVERNWGKLMGNSDLILEIADFQDKESFFASLSAQIRLITQAECQINLRISLQGELEKLRYANPEHAAFATAVFSCAFDAFNGLGGDVIGSSPRYEQVLVGSKNIFVPENRLCYLIGENLFGGQNTSKTEAEKIACGREVCNRIKNYISIDDEYASLEPPYMSSSGDMVLSRSGSERPSSIVSPNYSSTPAESLGRQ